MDVQEITRFEVLSEHHSSDWQHLAEISERATLFQTWEWAESWWRRFGRGKRLKVLLFRESGSVVGIAPFFQAAGPLRTLQLLGTGASDYLDLLALPGHEAAVAARLSAYLTETRRRWDWGDLQQIKPDAVATQIPDATHWTGETCPTLPLAPTYDAFLKTLSKKLRQNIGYYARALEKQYVVEYRLADTQTLNEDLDAFFELHQRRWNSRWMPGAFSSRQARSFHQDIARAQLAAGRLRLHTLLLDGVPQASLYTFHKGTTTYYYLGGFEPTLAKLSLGTVLTAHAIRHAIEHDNAVEFDFLRGNESYKYKWGALDRYNKRLSLTRPGVRPIVLSHVGKTSLELELRLKSAMHARHGGAGKEKK